MLYRVKMSLGISISYTGIRDGETVTSIKGGKAQNAGTIMQIKAHPKSRLKDVVYPPGRSWLSKMYKSDREGFYRQLTEIPFFSEMTEDEVEDWLYDHSTTNDDVYINEVRCLVKFIAIGGHGFTDRLTIDEISELQRGNPDRDDGYWDISDVYNMIPKIPGSTKKTRHTMVFRPSMWTLLIPKTSVESFRGTVISLVDRKVYDSAKASREVQLNVIPMVTRNGLHLIGGELCVESHVMKSRLILEDVYVIANEVTGINTSQYVKAGRHLEWFTPSTHKSLIQKLIRLRPKGVRFPVTKSSKSIRTPSSEQVGEPSEQVSRYTERERRL